jgi:hypothetical protein
MWQLQRTITLGLQLQQIDFHPTIELILQLAWPVRLPESSDNEP